MEYSVELKQRLIYNEISQSDLAKMLSVSKSAVSQWISGECVPSQKYKNFINEKLVVPEKEFKNEKNKKFDYLFSDGFWNEQFCLFL